VFPAHIRTDDLFDIIGAAKSGFAALNIDDGAEAAMNGHPRPASKHPVELNTASPDCPAMKAAVVPPAKEDRS